MNFRELEKIVLADGWELIRTKGSHHHYKHPSKKGTTTIPNHPGDIPKPIIKSVLRQARIEE
ncbi:MAG: type II toxin-antitoxin system HicA family toxin [Holophagaceae bacterium]|nr:type II toxin-antitoxin system HicA family toxin [Holophagaceae bacterium]